MRFNIFIIIILATIFFSFLGFWFYQRNLYSKEDLKLELLGPDSPQAFDEVEYVVKYKNNGDITLENVRMTFEYPEHSIWQETEQRIQTKTLEDIYPGQEKTYSFKTRLIGKERDPLVTKVLISYRPKNLDAKYESETTHTAVIFAVPLTLELDMPTRVENGKTFSFWANYFSRSDYPITDLRVSLDYPSGFSYLLSRPAGLAKNEWSIPLLNKAEGGRIEVQGILQGEMGGQKNYKAVLGLVRNNEFVPLKETSKSVAIARPSLYVTQLINGSPEYIANPGGSLHYELFFRNLGEEPLTDLFLAVRLDGRPFDFETLRSDSGKFSSGDNSIIWDWQNSSRLKFLGPGEEGSVDFWISLKEDWPNFGEGDKNFSIKDVVSIAQTREEFIVKVNAKPFVKQSAYFQDDIFGNEGSIPPEVGKTTTYTIVWKAESLYNDLTSAKVRAILPNNVKLTGKIFPEDASLTLDSESGEIVWGIGDLTAKGPSGNEGRSVAFQVALTPEHEDKGDTVTLIGSASLSAIDKWTGIIVGEASPEINTTLPDDISVTDEGGVVH